MYVQATPATALLLAKGTYSEEGDIENDEML